MTYNQNDYEENYNHSEPPPVPSRGGPPQIPHRDEHGGPPSVPHRDEHGSEPPPVPSRNRVFTHEGVEYEVEGTGVGDNPMNPIAEKSIRDDKGELGTLEVIDGNIDIIEDEYEEDYSNYSHQQQKNYEVHESPSPVKSTHDARVERVPTESNVMRAEEKPSEAPEDDNLLVTILALIAAQVGLTLCSCHIISIFMGLVVIFALGAKEDDRHVNIYKKISLVIVVFNILCEVLLILFIVIFVVFFPISIPLTIFLGVLIFMLGDVLGLVLLVILTPLIMVALIMFSPCLAVLFVVLMVLFWPCVYVLAMTIWACSVDK